MTLISVIVPVYNVEKYLDRCVKSIISQSFTDLEILLIDDGSNDSSGQRCDEWKKRDNRIKVIHKSNGGLSEARNVGLAAVTGEYTVFIDSDDWVHPNYIEILFDTLIQNNTDISCCDYKIVTEYQINETPIEFKTIVLSDEEALLDLIEKNNVKPVVWNKMYRTQIIKDISFKVGKYHEDEFYTYQVLSKAKRISYSAVKLYYYYQRSDSIMNTISLKHLDSLDAFIERNNYFYKYYPRLYYVDKIKYCKACIYYYIQKDKFKNSVDKYIYGKTIKEKRKQIVFTFNELIHYSIKNQLIIVGSRWCIWLMSEMLKIRIHKHD